MSKIYALPSASLLEFLAISREVRAAARGMTAADMREAKAEIYAASRVHRAPAAGDNSPLYAVDHLGRAHIAIEGMLVPHANPCAAIFGEAVTEYGYIIEATRAADDDPDVSAIVYDINSLGGYMDGCDIAAQAIAAASKKTRACVHGLAASAAYWLASQTDEIVSMTPAAQVGSIGVVCEEYDEDEALTREGVAHRIYTSTDAPDKRPDTKTPEGRAKIVAQLDDLHRVFVSRVSQGRHVSADKVNKDFGHGGLLIASAALKAGMIDEIIGLNISRQSAVVDGSAAAQAAIKDKEVRMDLNQLKAEHPEAYKAANEEGMTAGISKERTRIAALASFAAADSGNAKVQAIVAEAIASGKTAEEVQPQLLVAIRDGAALKPAGENAPDIGTSHAKTVGGVSPISAEDREWYKAHGLTDEQIDKMAADDAANKKE